MHQFYVGGIHRGVLMELDFKSWKIGLVFVIFGSNNYEKSKVLTPCTHLSFYPSWLHVENMVELK
jgi:hypothetical protein